MLSTHCSGYIHLLFRLFNRSRAFRRAWDLGWGALGEGAFSKQRFQTLFPTSFATSLKLYQNVCQIGPGGVLEASWRALGALTKAWSAQVGLPGASGSLLERSWNALGGLWGRKDVIERLLAGPRRIPREFSAILGAEGLPKWRPSGSKIEPKRRFELKMAKPRFLITVK